jgi:hypothetical protein
MIAGRHLDLPSDLRLSLSHDTFNIASQRVEANIDSSLQPFATDQRRSFPQFDSRQFAQRNEGTGGGGQKNVADRFDAVPIGFWIAEDQIETLLALVDTGGRLRPDGRGNDFPDVGHVDAVTGDLAPVDVDGQIGLSE